MDKTVKNTDLSVRCTLLPYRKILGIIPVLQCCKGEKCPLENWMEHSNPAEIASGNFPFKISISVSHPLCKIFGDVSGYGIAGKFRQNQWPRKEPWVMPI